MADEIIPMFNNVENMDIEVIRKKTKQMELQYLTKQPYKIIILKSNKQ